MAGTGGWAKKDAASKAKAQVKGGPYSRGGYSWVQIDAADHDFRPEAQLVPIGILAPAPGELAL